MILLTSLLLLQTVYPADYTACKPKFRDTVCVYINTAEALTSTSTGTPAKIAFIDYVKVKVNGKIPLPVNTKGLLVVELPKDKYLRIRVNQLGFRPFDEKFLIKDSNTRVMVLLKRIKDS